MWFFLAPKRAELAAGILRKKRMGRLEDSVQVLVEEKIRRTLCAWQDMCSYRPQSWGEVERLDAYGVQITHKFYLDDKLNSCLFRVRHGAVSEIIDLP